MKTFLRPVALAPVLALLLVAAACTDREARTNPTQTSGGTSPVGTSGSLPTGIPGGGSAELASFQSSRVGAVNGSGQQGIWVTGVGQVTMQPDVARLALGVEAWEDTVAQAQAGAATAMDAIVTRLREMGVADEDMRTQHLSIQPVIRYERVTRDGREYNEQRIDGYRVSTTVAADLRDLERVGEIIDAVAGVGGDLTRIQGISFTVENQSVARTLARELATQDALAKAQQFAQILSIEVGSPVFVTEVGGGGPITQNYNEARATAAMDAAPPMPILAGELEVTARVQVVFAIP